MPPLFRRHSNIICFFCQTPASPLPKNPRNFRCTSCSCWNRYDANGEILSDDPAMHDETLNKQSFARRASPRKDRFPTSYGPGPFCHTCQTNQMLIVNLLSSYLPPPESHEYTQRLEMLPVYRESLHTRYPPVCESCTAVVEDEIRKKDQMARAQALGAWLKDSKGKETQRRVSGTGKDRERGAVELYWWKIRGGLWLATSGLSLMFNMSAIFGYRPFFFLRLLQPVFPLFVLFSILWTVWDPTYASLRRAQRQGRDVRVIGKKEYIVLQMITWSTRLLTSILFWLRWRNSKNDYFELYDPSSQLARIYFSTITAIEVIAQISSFYCIRLKQPPTVRLIDTHTHHFTPSRSSTPYPSSSGSRGDTPAPGLPQPKDPLQTTSEPDLLAALSLSSKPVITPKNPVFGLPSLLSNPPSTQINQDDGDDVDEDENAMDWTPTDPRIAASRKRKNNAKQTDDNVWLRPQKFFAPEKPTGLESLFARTKLDDDAMMVDGQEEEPATGGSMSAKLAGHFRRWWWIYATVIVPVVVAVVVRRVWHFEISITTVGKGSTAIESTSPLLAGTPPFEPSLESVPTDRVDVDW